MTIIFCLTVKLYVTTAEPKSNVQTFSINTLMLLSFSSYVKETILYWPEALSDPIGPTCKNKFSQYFVALLRTLMKYLFNHIILKTSKHQNHDQPAQCTIHPCIVLPAVPGQQCTAIKRIIPDIHLFCIHFFKR